jgi:Cyclic nucleotide-binding domain
MAIKRKASFNPKTFLAKVGEGPSIGRYRSDEILFSQGDPADSVFYIQKGKVKITVVSEQGKEAVVAILGTNEFFGEGCLAAQVQRIATVRTMGNANISAAKGCPNQFGASISTLRKAPYARDAPSGRLPMSSPTPRHPPPPRMSRIMSKSTSAPMVALVMAAIMPKPRWMPS